MSEVKIYQHLQKNIFFFLQITLVSDQLQLSFIYICVRIYEICI